MSLADGAAPVASGSQIALAGRFIVQFESRELSAWRASDKNRQDAILARAFH